QSRVAGVALGGSAGGAGGSGTGPAGAAKVVYFDYDSFAIKSEYQGLLEAEAKALAARPAGRLVIEGHTDERGGSEYNLALGQKRAEAVLRVLVLLGAPAQRMEAVSFGKERPAVDGHDEAAWAKNRRAELKDE
ncbi:MAG: peptidoglycan-associated lipoprotein Pal, partial [Burkholderiales bacterium]|nr:peptidoglycan-associated lipoprotein Pal [Burkholderiales bacterium]